MRVSLTDALNKLAERHVHSALRLELLTAGLRAIGTHDPILRWASSGRRFGVN
jgi:hypothetical protein